MLLMSAMDALARVIYSTEPSNRNRKRFTSFVEKSSKWSDGWRVSLPHLAQLLEKTTDSQFFDLQQFVKEKMKGWKSGRDLSIEVDPELKQIEKLWPKSGNLNNRLKGLIPDSLTHNKLLYVYRNTLIHEFRSPSADCRLYKRRTPLHVSNYTSPWRVRRLGA